MDHTPFPGFGAGREDVKRLFAMLRSAFPDLRGEVVSSLWMATGWRRGRRFTDASRGVFWQAGSGKRVAIRVMDIVRIKDGKIAEHWNVVDVAGLMAQL